MDSMFRGEVVSNTEFIKNISKLKDTVEKDLIKDLDLKIVVNALDQLGKQINKDEIVLKVKSLGIPKWAVIDYIEEALQSLDKLEIIKKVNKELGKNPYEWNTFDNIEEKMYPLGAIMHIGASNALGLSAMSVMEGLLTKNINILKLPGNEGGISLELLQKLVEIEPRLKPYIYVINVSSKNEEVISELIKTVDAVTIWGGDDAINAIRNLTPPTIKIIEWGHRLSLAYFTKSDNLNNDLKALAKEVAKTDQLYCSSPQCVFFETNDRNELNEFAERLFNEIKDISRLYPANYQGMDVQSEITWTRELVKAEEVFSNKKLIVDETYGYSVMIDYTPKLKPSPLFRNIWVMPIKREEVFKILKHEKGHLQTVGLSCMKKDLDELTKIFYSSGVNRITKCGGMSINYSGEPHDGEYALSRYVRIVNKRI